ARERRAKRLRGEASSTGHPVVLPDLGDFCEGNAEFLARRAIADVNIAVLQRLLTDSDARRDPDEIGVRELLAGAELAIVQQHRSPRLLERGADLFGLVL